MTTFREPEQQFQYLTALAQLQRFPNSWIIEIGSFRGGSAQCFAQAIMESQATSPESRLVCVDPFYGCYDEGLQAVLKRDHQGASSFVPFCETVGPERLQYVIPIATRTARAQALLAQLWPRFSLALVDADHTWQAQLLDLTTVRSLMISPGGIILCHDASWEDTQIATRKFCAEGRYALIPQTGGDFAQITL